MATPCYASLQDAIDAAADGSIIKVAEGVYTNTSTQVVYVDKVVVVSGGYSNTDWNTSYPVSQATIIDAENVLGRRGMFINVPYSGEVLVENLTVRNGNLSNLSGAGVHVLTGTVSLLNIHIVSNTVTTVGFFDGGGAGIYVEDSASISLASTSIEDNHVIGYGYGGGVFVRMGHVVANDSILASNSAGSTGGGMTVWDESARVSISASLFTTNTAEQGGGLSVRSGNVAIHGITFTQNSASFGGALLINAGVVSIEGSNFAQNSASNSGGAIVLDNGMATLTSNHMFSNTAHSEGGAVFVTHGVFTMTSNTITGNVAQQLGGAISTASPQGRLTLLHNVLQNNSATDGGGALNVAGGTVVMDGNQVQDNSSSVGDGGGLAITNGKVSGANNTIANNHAPWSGVRVTGGVFTATYLTLSGNGAYAILNSGGFVTLTNSIATSHSVSAISGVNTNANHSLFFNSPANCDTGAVCSNSWIGDPLFKDPEQGDFHISAGSPAIDRALDTRVLVDADGEPRPMQYGYDLGADELPPRAYFSTNSPILLGTALVVTNTTIATDDPVFTWHFGDGSTSNSPNPVHIYDYEGPFTVTLVVTSETGSSSTSLPVVVDGSPPSGNISVVGLGLEVSLVLTATDSLLVVTSMQLANNPALDQALWEPFQPTRSWTLGTNHIVYARFRDQVGNVSTVYSAHGRWGVFLPLILR